MIVNCKKCSKNMTYLVIKHLKSEITKDKVVCNCENKKK